ncbi:MAG: hypothetical protein QM770_02245 [Tepidisphaeraceae bacterium]
MSADVLSIATVAAATATAIPTLLFGVREALRRCADTPASDDARRFALMIKLRQWAFDRPLSLREAVETRRAAEMLRQLWHEVDAEHSASAGDDERWTDEGFFASSDQLYDGRYVAVLTLPPPSRSFEPYSVAVVMPSKESLRMHFDVARKQIRFFVLKRLSCGQVADLSCWTLAGQQRTYRVGPAPGTPGFLRILDAKVQELGL